MGVTTYPYGQMLELSGGTPPANDDQTRYRVGKLCELIDEAIVRRGSVDWSAVERALIALNRLAADPRRWWRRFRRGPVSRHVN